MSDLNQAQRQNLNLIADAPPTQPQGLPEAPMVQNVQDAEELLRMLEGVQAADDLYAHFGVKSADDLAETDRVEFIRLAKMNGEDRAEFVGSKRTGPPPIAVEPNGNTTITMRNNAVALARMGFPVFPINAYQTPEDPTADAIRQAEKRAKTPVLGFSQKKASADPELVHGMWSAPDGSLMEHNIGLAITDDFFVLDIDSDKGGDDSLQQLELKYGPLPPTVTVKTQSGGRHYYFRTGGRKVKNSVGIVGKGIDVRGAESYGYVLAPGSVINGKSYAWVSEPNDTAVGSMAEAPNWLFDRMPTGARAERDPMSTKPLCALDQGHNVELARLLIRGTEPAIEGDGGREHTMQLSRELHDIAISPDEQLELLTEPFVKAGQTQPLSWNDRCSPPWSLGPDCLREDDLEYLLQESWDSCRSRPGCKTKEGRAAQAQEAFEPVELEYASDNEVLAGVEAEPAMDLVLSLADWAKRDLPPPDYICGRWLSTTSRVLLVAPTGIGKTMFCVGLAMAISAGRDFLHWEGVRPAKVLYIDGEMSNRLFKQRLMDEITRLGLAPETFYALSREDVPGFAPLNSPEGQAYIDSLIKHLGGVDLIAFDNTMSLISGDHREEEGWRQTLPWALSLTRRGIGQIWVHHTGHDESRTYGTKTREWQMDTVLHMDRVKRGDTDVSFELQFKKARERRPQNRTDFDSARIALVGNRWSVANVTGFEARLPPTPQEEDWIERLSAWMEDEREALKLPSEAEIPITVEVVRRVIYSTDAKQNDAKSASDIRVKGQARSTIVGKLSAMSEKGLLRKGQRGQWFIQNVGNVGDLSE